MVSFVDQKIIYENHQLFRSFCSDGECDYGAGSHGYAILGINLLEIRDGLKYY